MSQELKILQLLPLFNVWFNAWSMFHNLRFDILQAQCVNNTASCSLALPVFDPLIAWKNIVLCSAAYSDDPQKCLNNAPMTPPKGENRGQTNKKDARKGGFGKGNASDSLKSPNEQNDSSFDEAPPPLTPSVTDPPLGKQMAMPTEDGRSSEQTDQPESEGGGRFEVVEKSFSDSKKINF